MLAAQGAPAAVALSPGEPGCRCFPHARGPISPSAAPRALPSLLSCPRHEGNFGPPCNDLRTGDPSSYTCDSWAWGLGASADTRGPGFRSRRLAAGPEVRGPVSTAMCCPVACGPPKLHFSLAGPFRQGSLDHANLPIAEFMPFGDPLRRGKARLRGVLQRVARTMQ